MPDVMQCAQHSITAKQFLFTDTLKKKLKKQGV